jgi:hypothetical protein
MKRLAIIAVLTVFVSGCVSTNSAIVSNTEEATFIKVVDDKFNPMIALIGPTHRASSVSFNPISDELATEKSWYIMTNVYRSTGKDETLIAFSDIYKAQNWKFYSFASDEHGNVLDVAKGHSSVIDCDPSLGMCSYSENVLISIDKKALLSAKNNGYSIKIRGSSGGEFIVNISSADAQAQLAAISENGRRLKPERQADR